MNSCVQILPGIKKLGYLECASLSARVDLNAIHDTPVGIYTEIYDITFFGEPECKCETKKTNNGWSQEATLKFFSSEMLPVYDNLAFVVMDVAGDTYLIGSKEKPFPVVKVERAAGTTGTSAGYSYEISHKAIRTLIKCVW